ncbi:hypothetical protein F373_gp061 [Bacillus phage SP-10]|uniref:hypothetical protein n=1 Tax=Bacillus phage SP10 TaxID=941058 RepID=UPI0002198B11|nr:hypothetical protein F373_gp061 [Bacillus phage SP-10]BAK52873.1 hypothetical protein [Bacillus phage SP-10]
MLAVKFDKGINVTMYSPKTRTEVSARHLYKDLPELLSGVGSVIVDYPFGMRETRVKQLDKLGFRLINQLKFDDSAPHKRVVEIWNRTTKEEAV